MQEETILREAEFNPKVTFYWLLTGVWILAITVFGIVLIPIWLVVGRAFTLRYLKRMRCTLTDRSLKVSYGLLNRVEKTVPLDKITDLGLVQGPIMRYLDLEALSVETASTSVNGAAVRMVGIVDGRAFRDAVLKERDRVTAIAGTPTSPAPQPTPTPTGSDALLQDIRDTLLRIEEKLGEK
jgi:putative membrane protein